MSDHDDVTNTTPLSSNSSGPSGTTALSVSIDEEPQKNKHSKDDSNTPEQHMQLDADNENLPYDAAQQDGASQDVVTNETSDNFPADENFGTSSAPFEQQNADIADFGAQDNSYDASVENQPAQDDTSYASSDSVPAYDNVPAYDQPVNPAPFEQPIVEAQDAIDKTTDELRQAVLQSMTENENRSDEAYKLFEEFSQNFSEIMQTARDDAAVFGFKLMEFAQANVQNNFDLARAYSEARSIPDVLKIQTEYMQRQLNLLNSQAEQLRSLTSEYAVKAANDMQSRVSR